MGTVEVSMFIRMAAIGIAGLMAAAGSAVGQDGRPSLLDPGQAGRIEQAPQRVPSAKENAALTYMRMFLARPEAFENEPEDQDTSLFAPLNEELAGSLEENQWWIEQLLVATSMERCDFGIRIDMGWETIIPHAGYMRNAARILAYDANRLFETDPNESIERVAGTLGMSRHMVSAGEGQVLIEVLVGLAIGALAEAQITELLEAGEMRHSWAKRFLAEFEKFDDEDPYGYRSGLRQERRFAIATIERWFGHENPGQKLADEMLESWGDTSMEASESMRALRDMTEADLVQELQRYDEAFLILESSWDDDDAMTKLQNLERVIGDGHFGVVARLLWPSYSSIVEVRMRKEADREELIRRLRQVAG